MQNEYKTPRLKLQDLSINDAEFIQELVNTEGWIKFIGDRNIRSADDAKQYIQKIIDNPNIRYWVVRLQTNDSALGVITIIKRDYLDDVDIGFAFLPSSSNKGYAYEGAQIIISDLIKNPGHKFILATTLKENISSIRLLEKLGLRFDRSIEVENEILQVYSASTDKLAIDMITKSFFSIFTNTDQQAPQWEEIYRTNLAGTLIIKKNNNTEEICTLDTFIEPRKKILTDGTLTEFEEKEISEETKVIGNIAQRFSKYRKHGYRNGVFFEGTGNKLFQFTRTTGGWKICSVLWEDEIG